MGRVTFMRPIPAGETTIFNSHVISELRQLLPAADFLAIAASFADDCRACAQGLEEAAARGDWPTVRKEAHKVKGIFLQYGVIEGEELASALCSRALDASCEPDALRLADLARKSASGMEKIAHA